MNVLALLERELNRTFISEAWMIEFDIKQCGLLLGLCWLWMCWGLLVWRPTLFMSSLQIIGSTSSQQGQQLSSSLHIQPRQQVLVDDGNKASTSMSSFTKPLLAPSVQSTSTSTGDAVNAPKVHAQKHWRTGFQVGSILILLFLLNRYKVHLVPLACCRLLLDLLVPEELLLLVNFICWMWLL